MTAADQDPNYADEDPATRGQPAQDKRRYNCPYPTCDAYSFMVTGGLQWAFEGENAIWIDGWAIHRCSGCKKPILWHRDTENDQWALIYPSSVIGTPPNPDMPADVLALYEEARQVAPLSRKSAAALLRLALQLLIDQLETGPGNLNDKIGRLTQRGLLSQTQQAMDVLRIVGNNAVHPGQIDLDDNPELVPSLFRLMNAVVEQLITVAQHAQALFNSLPAASQSQVQRRDGQASAATT